MTSFRFTLVRIMTITSFSMQIENGIVRAKIENTNLRFYGFGKDKMPILSQASKDSPMIYVLCDANGMPVYVGQSGNGMKRVEQHIIEGVKDFELVVAFELVNAKYLNFVESWFIATLRDYKLVNRTAGNKSGLDEFDTAIINNELEHIFIVFRQMIIAVYGVNAPTQANLCIVANQTEQIEDAIGSDDANQTEQIEDAIGSDVQIITPKPIEVINTEMFQFTFLGHVVNGAHVSGDREFTVFAGSNMRFNELSSIHACGSITRALRRELINQKIVELVGDKYVFVKDYTFQQIAHAGTVCYGGTLNARTAFKTHSGRSHRAMVG